MTDELTQNRHHHYGPTHLDGPRVALPPATRRTLPREPCRTFNAVGSCHRHSGIGWHTPASVHFGTSDAIDDARQATLDATYAAHPEQFARRPTTPRIPKLSWINERNQNCRPPEPRTVSLDLTDTDPAPGQGLGPQGFRDFFTELRSAFPDLHIEHVHPLATGDEVAFAYSVTGNHSGPLMGHAATGKAVDVRGVQIGRFTGGKLSKRWGSFDQLGILTQLGLV